MSKVNKTEKKDLIPKKNCNPSAPPLYLIDNNKNINYSIYLTNSKSFFSKHIFNTSQIFSIGCISIFFKTLPFSFIKSISF